MDDLGLEHLQVAPDYVGDDFLGVFLLEHLFLLEQFFEIALVAVLLDDICVILGVDHIEHLDDVVRVELLHHVYLVLEELLVVLIH